MSNQLTTFLSHLKESLSFSKKVKDLDKGDYTNLIKVLQDHGILTNRKSAMNHLAEILQMTEDTQGFGWTKDHNRIDKDVTLTANTLWMTHKTLPVLKDHVQEVCYDYMIKTSKELGMKIIDGELHENLIHLALQYPIHASFGHLVETLQHKSSTFLKSNFPHLAEELDDMPLWELKSVHWSQGNRLEEFKYQLKSSIQEESDRETKEPTEIAE